MSVFIDTGAFLAVLNADDQFHGPAKKTWIDILSTEKELFTSNYILLETFALLQRRLGLEALRVFHDDILPIVQTYWIDESIYKMGISALLAANRRSLSLVDCTSFEIIRQMDIDQVFTFDSHFSELGFNVTPS